MDAWDVFPRHRRINTPETGNKGVLFFKQKLDTARSKISFDSAFSGAFPPSDPIAHRKLHF